MYEKQIKFISEYLEIAQKHKEQLIIILVMNVKGITQDFNDYDQSSVISEYYSYSQYEEIFYSIKNLGYCVKCYFDENDFIMDFQNGVIRNNYPRKMLVINSAQKGIGPGRKSLIPAFCQLHNIMCSSSDPYIVSFARNKFHWYCFLRELSYPTCPSWFYSRRSGWLDKRRPNIGETVIIKLNNESSSIGLSKANVIQYGPDKDCEINKICNTFKQDVIIEKFISGYETEVPILISSTAYCSLFPAGISINKKKYLGDNFLDYEIRGEHLFEHYEFESVDPKLSKHLEKMTEHIALSMGIKNIGRVDYRIDNQGNFYVTDIATNPHITKSMTFYYEFQKFGLSYQDVLELLIGLSISWRL